MMVLKNQNTLHFSNAFTRLSIVEFGYDYTISMCTSDGYYATVEVVDDILASVAIVKPGSTIGVNTNISDTSESMQELLSMLSRVGIIPLKKTQQEYDRLWSELSIHELDSLTRVVDSALGNIVRSANNRIVEARYGDFIFKIRQLYDKPSLLHLDLVIFHAKNGVKITEVGIVKDINTYEVYSPDNHIINTCENNILSQAFSSALYAMNTKEYIHLALLLSIIYKYY